MCRAQNLNARNPRPMIVPKSLHYDDTVMTVRIECSAWELPSALLSAQLALVKTLCLLCVGCMAVVKVVGNMPIAIVSCECATMQVSMFTFCDLVNQNEPNPIYQ